MSPDFRIVGRSVTNEIVLTPLKNCKKTDTIKNVSVVESKINKSPLLNLNLNKKFKKSKGFI
jgi:hypothetical protein